MMHYRSLSPERQAGAEADKGVACAEVTNEMLVVWSENDLTRHSRIAVPQAFGRFPYELV
ncbi:hypothetical protein [Rhizobium sp. IMFF44]|uniref:hypothetical protein n=1 Tax=Rhizobium sp. IMFF44 TaxID=3342350 RepID=UPI0035BC4D5C